MKRLSLRELVYFTAFLMWAIMWNSVNPEDVECPDDIES